MDLLFNHPTKIFFKRDRSSSIASHTCVVPLIAMGETRWLNPRPHLSSPDEAHRREPGTLSHGGALLLGRSEPGAPAMSIIPLHFKRRFEQRWASRFTLPNAPKNVGTKATQSTVGARGKDQRKARRVETAGLTVLSRYEYESAIDQDGSRTRLTNIRPLVRRRQPAGSRLVREHFEFARYPASVSSRTGSRGHVAISCQAWIGKSLKHANCSPVSSASGVSVRHAICIVGRRHLRGRPCPVTGHADRHAIVGDRQQSGDAPEAETAIDVVPTLEL